ncbi:MAG: hypothetical protein HC945_04225 [Nitrosarchaeum sp.]|nr:hypothetical protein [Nitrosarchaeum sp.]
MFNASRRYVQDVGNGTQEVLEFYNSTQANVTEEEARAIALEVYTLDFLRAYEVYEKLNPVASLTPEQVRESTNLTLSSREGNLYCFDAQTSIPISRKQIHIVAQFPASVRVKGYVASSFPVLGCSR